MSETNSANLGDLKDGNMNLQMKLLDVVAFIEDLPELGLYRGQKINQARTK